MQYHDPGQDAAMPDPVLAIPPGADELEKEFLHRCETSGQRASELEAQASEWRRVEHACAAALKAIHAQQTTRG